VPAFGSVSARPPRISPVANLGRYFLFSSSDPYFSTSSAIIRCELKMPVSDIHTAEMRDTISV
jgi:hypothetical protein